MKTFWDENFPRAQHAHVFAQLTHLIISVFEPFCSPKKLVYPERFCCSDPSLQTLRHTPASLGGPCQARPEHPSGESPRHVFLWGWVGLPSALGFEDEYRFRSSHGTVDLPAGKGPHQRGIWLPVGVPFVLYGVFINYFCIFHIVILWHTCFCSVLNN